jgi:hypothetical protein
MRNEQGSIVGTLVCACWVMLLLFGATACSSTTGFDFHVGITPVNATSHTDELRQEATK